MKRQILSFLLALIGLTSAWAEDYGVSVGGVAVTSSNYTNISASGGFPAVSSGTVRYNPTTRTLTLTDAVISISGGYSGIDFNGFSEDYNLVLTEGTVNVVTAVNAPGLSTSRPLTISGGTAVIKSYGHCGIYLHYDSTSDYTLSIQNCTVMASGNWGIAGDTEYGTVDIENSIVSATGTTGSMCDLKGVTLTGTALYQPEGAAWDNASNAVCDVGGTKVTTTITYLPENATGSSAIGLTGDVNGDNAVNLTDVTTLVNQILVGGYVNLGLPSGTLWATCNIGAANPENYGDYFAWGETVPYGREDTSNSHNYDSHYRQSYEKTTFSWNTYKWCKGTSYSSLTKYCNNNRYGYSGFTDTKTELDLEDDAAYVNWGSNWRMPSYDQQNELRTKCIWTWTSLNGSNGYQITGPNGNSIFLPAAGDRYYDSLSDTGSNGYYWSRTLTESPDNAYTLYFKSSGVAKERYYGLPVRPVRKQ